MHESPAGEEWKKNLRIVIFVGQMIYIWILIYLLKALPPAHGDSGGLAALPHFISIPIFLFPTSLYLSKPFFKFPNKISPKFELTELTLFSLIQLLILGVSSLILIPVIGMILSFTYETIFK